MRVFPHHSQAKTVGKMGLKNVAGLRVEGMCPGENVQLWL